MLKRIEQLEGRVDSYADIIRSNQSVLETLRGPLALAEASAAEAATLKTTLQSWEARVAAAGAVEARCEALLKENAALKDVQYFGALPSMICPITLEIFTDPVQASDGHMYERAVVRRWFDGHDTSPKTGKPLPLHRRNGDMVPNKRLMEVACMCRLIADYKEAFPSSE
jgi:hypothetical protein